MADNKPVISNFNHSYTERIIFSQQFRSMQDKTQLFFPSQKQRVRTRLTHTMEVKTIAHQIGSLINEKIRVSGGKRPGSDEDIIPVNLELVDAIAQAHDIGHTAFGHVGERTIDEVVSGEDDLGGLLKQAPTTPMRFKHNCNGMRILVDMGITDWRITEGTLAHTKIFYKKDKTQYSRNPYHPFANAAYNRLAEFIFDLNGVNIASEEKAAPPSLTLEGQIVAMADEIAQRAADLGDAKVQARYLDNIEKMFKPYLQGKTIPKAYQDDPFVRLEWIIYNTMIHDAADAAFCKYHALVPRIVKGPHGISHPVLTVKDKDTSKEKPVKVVTFSEGMDQINEKLETFITKFSAQSEEVRASDSRAKHIIRQLYKAYINDMALLPDTFMERYLNSVVTTQAFKEVCGLFPNKTRGDGKVLEMIRTKRLYVGGRITQGHKQKPLDMGLVNDFFAIVRRLRGSNANAAALFDAFVLEVGCHIAAMTNTEAFDLCNKVYGHTL